jgi:hypothetical protein
MSTTKSDGAPAPDLPLDPDEPHTPFWFTVLGLGLFLLAGIFLLTQSGDDDKVTSSPDAAAGSVEAPANDAPKPAENAPAPDPHAGHGHD